MPRWAFVDGAVHHTCHGLMRPRAGRVIGEREREKDYIMCQAPFQCYVPGTF